MKTDRRARGLYWDQAWKLVEGCRKVSPGCDNCWSQVETAMRAVHPNKKISDRASKVLCDDYSTEFSGHIVCREDNLELPLRTKKPTVFAVWNDLYHEDVPDEFRDRTYAVMALCPQHTFLVLTKRAERMAEYWNKKPRPPFIDRSYMICEAAETYHGADIDFVEELLYEHVWHGVTAENQQTANERIPYLLRVPGKRFLSIEPMLGPVILDQHINAEDDLHCDYCGGFTGDGAHDCYEPEIGIHAVLLGGESGKNARPMHPNWVRTVRDQCAQADIPFTFKQWGTWAANCLCGRSKVCKTIKRPEGFLGVMFRCGKKSGRDLDGVIHNNLPWDEKTA